MRKDGRGAAKKDVRFINIILLISLIAVLILPLYVIYFLTPAFTDFLLDDTEKRLIQVAERMAGSLEDEGSIGYQSITPHFIQRLEDIRKSIGLTKVKIFAVDSTIVYSTDPKDIGNKSNKSFFPEVVATGYPRSYIATKEVSGGSPLSNQHQIIETYVPIINGNNYDVVGVFEIYYDITSTNKALDRLTQRVYFVLLVIVLVLLSAVLLSVSRARANMRKREFAELEIRRQKELLEHQHCELAEMHEQAQALSLQDHLTGLGNRRLLEIHFDRAFALAHRYGKELALIMLDVDHFKAYNDNNGHQAGDLALVNLATIIRKQLRETDLAFRYGGEEFLLLLPEIDMESGLRVAEKLRMTVAGNINVTISMGVTAYRPGATIDGMIREADEALYKAKLQGRNRVVSAE
jgi:diguanylate cyclase (GGDEF)-like protein